MIINIYGSYESHMNRLVTASNECAELLTQCFLIWSFGTNRQSIFLLEGAKMWTV